MTQTIIETLDEKLGLEDSIFSNMLDVSRFFIPAEIYTSEKNTLSPYNP